MFKEFGVRLSFTPTVLGGDLINLKVKPEVSSLDFANAVTHRRLPRAGALDAPHRDRSRAAGRTDVRDRRPDEQHRDQSRCEDSRHRRHPDSRLPVPSKAYQKNQTELVVMITPTSCAAARRACREGCRARRAVPARRPKTMPPPAPYIGSPRYPASQPSRGAPSAAPARSRAAPRRWRGRSRRRAALPVLAPRRRSRPGRPRPAAVRGRSRRRPSEGAREAARGRDERPRTAAAKQKAADDKRLAEEARMAEEGRGRASRGEKLDKERARREARSRQEERRESPRKKAEEDQKNDRAARRSRRASQAGAGCLPGRRWTRPRGSRSDEGDLGRRLTDGINESGEHHDEDSRTPPIAMNRA